jgi:hypothetical protein
MDDIAKQLQDMKKRVNTAFLVSGISYRQRISKLQKIIKYTSEKNKLSILDSTIKLSNKGRDKFLRLQFLVAGYELLINNDYAEN